MSLVRVSYSLGLGTTPSLVTLTPTGVGATAGVGNIALSSPVFMQPTGVQGTAAVGTPGLTGAGTTYATPTLGTRGFDAGVDDTFITPYIKAPYPSFKNGSGGDPTYSATAGHGHRIMPTGGRTGAGSYRFDIPDTTAGEVVRYCEVGRTNNLSTAFNAPELYWKFYVQFNGTAQPTAFKWMRPRTNSGDIGGWYQARGGGGTHIAFCFGSHGTADNNFFHALGISVDALPAGLVSTYGYTPYGQNLRNDGLFHCFMMHYQQGPTANALPRVRLWFDHQPIIQAPNTMKAAHSMTQTATPGVAVWSAPLANDPDYGAFAPSWLTVNSRVTSENIFLCDMNTTYNIGGTGTGNYVYDDMEWSTTPLAP